MPIVSLAGAAARQESLLLYRSACGVCPHRQGTNRRPLCNLAGGRNCYELTRERNCPDHRFYGQLRPRPTAPVPAVRPTDPVRGPWVDGKGAAAWGRLHMWALKSPEESSGREWLEGFIESLATCGNCRKDFRTWVQANPCPWGDTSWGWSVSAHNAVNRKLGRPEWAEGKARERWDPASTFSSVYVICHPKDLSRRERFFREVEGMTWPFRRPEVIEGGDGSSQPGGGTAGCMAGHRAALKAALDAGGGPVLIFEDDATFEAGFAEKALDWLGRCPPGADGYWFGHQNADWVPDGEGKPHWVREGVVRTVHPHRCHAYALRGDAIRAAYDRLMEALPWKHADHELGPLGRLFHFYASDPPLVGQAAGRSHLSGRPEGVRFWQSRPRTSTRALLSLNLYGDKMRPNVRESLREAASRWGARFVEVREPLGGGDGNALSEKLRLDQYAQGFTHVIAVDRDVVIREYCPCLFDFATSGSFGAAYDDNVVSGRNPHGLRQMNDACRRLNLPPAAAHQYFNSGVLIFQPPIHDLVFAKARELADLLPRSWPFFDQGVLSLALALTSTTVKVLPRECNPCGHVFWGDVRAGRAGKYPVMHFCGEPDRDRWIDKAVWKVRPSVQLESRPTVFLPFYGEFGVLVLEHARQIHAHPAREKIVCCVKGQECLFPSAVGFFYGWENPLPDHLRVGSSGAEGNVTLCGLTDVSLRDQLTLRYPGREVVRLHYDISVDPEKVLKIRFQPSSVPARLSGVDVVIAARGREFAPFKNFSHWPAVVKALRAQGLRVGLAGTRETTLGLESDVRAWEHPGGPTEGTVDLLRHCRLYLGTDTGVTHIASLIDVPMVVFRHPHTPELGDGDDLLELAGKVTKGPFTRLSPRAWEDPEEVVSGTFRALRSDVARPRAFYAEYGEDRWLSGNRDLPARGVFVEVGGGPGRMNSNTYAFEEVGWEGIVVEPDPRRHQEIRSQRRACLYTCAVARHLGWADFGLEDCPDLSGLLRSGRRRIPVETRPLEDLLRQSNLGVIDLLSIDTEGTELEVWKSFDVAKYRPRFVIIEWNTIGLPDRRQEIIVSLAADGYRVIHETTANLIFEPSGEGPQSHNPLPAFAGGALEPASVQR